MKKILLILSIALMVICNWNLAKADCNLPFMSAVKTYTYPGTNCIITVKYCYMCHPDYFGVTFNVDEWTYTKTGLASDCNISDKDIREFLEQQFNLMAPTICDFYVPCKPDNSSHVTIDLYLPVCVTYMWDHISQVVVVKSCSNDASNQCHHVCTLCYKYEEDGAHVGEINCTYTLMGTPACTSEDWSGFQAQTFYPLNKFLVDYQNDPNHLGVTPDFDFYEPGTQYNPDGTISYNLNPITCIFMPCSE